MYHSDQWNENSNKNPEKYRFFAEIQSEVKKSNTPYDFLCLKNEKFAKKKPKNPSRNNLKHYCFLNSYQSNILIIPAKTP